LYYASYQYQQHDAPEMTITRRDPQKKMLR